MRADVGAQSQVQTFGKRDTPTQVADQAPRCFQLSILRHRDAGIQQETVATLQPQPDSPVLRRQLLDPRDRRLDGLTRPR